MKGKFLAIGSAVAAVLVLSVSLSSTTEQSQDATPNRAPRTADEFDEMFSDLSNWGRWGADDELGAFNLITPAKRRQAAALVRNGISVSLSHNPMTEVAEDNPVPFGHVMSENFRADTFHFTYHGYAISHIDALCHFQYKGMLYNGIPMGVNSEKGCGKLGIQNLKNGIVTRGILIDIPRLKGVPYLEPSTPIYLEDIEAWEQKAGVKVSAGDAIFLLTGRWARRAALGPWTLSGNAAGFHASVGPWIKARDVAFVGSDSATDVQPSRVEGLDLPLHTFLIAGLGINILDNMDLEALAATAAKANRWEFMLTIGPIPVTGGTGSPVNALAIF